MNAAVNMIAAVSTTAAVSMIAAVSTTAAVSMIAAVRTIVYMPSMGTHTITKIAIIKHNYSPEPSDVLPNASPFIIFSLPG